MQMWARVGRTVERVVRPKAVLAKRKLYEDIALKGRLFEALSNDKNFQTFMSMIRQRRDEVIGVMLNGNSGKEEFETLRARAKTYDEVLELVGEVVKAGREAATSLGGQ